MTHGLKISQDILKKLARVTFDLRTNFKNKYSIFSPYKQAKTNLKAEIHLPNNYPPELLPKLSPNSNYSNSNKTFHQQDDFFFSFSLGGQKLCLCQKCCSKFVCMFYSLKSRP